MFRGRDAWLLAVCLVVFVYCGLLCLNVVVWVCSCCWWFVLFVFGWMGVVCLLGYAFGGVFGCLIAYVCLMIARVICCWLACLVVGCFSLICMVATCFGLFGCWCLV